MITKSLMIAQILFLWICIDLNCVSAISRDYKYNASVTNHSNYDYERDPRQFLGGYGGSGLGGLGGLGGILFK